MVERAVASFGRLDMAFNNAGIQVPPSDAADEPELPILINHCGGPLGIGPYEGHREEVFADWSRGIRKVAALPNAYIKLSGLGMGRMGFHFEGGGPAQTSDELVGAWTPYVRTCLDAFGPERSIFASNFPVEREAATYRTLLNAYKKMLLDLSVDEQQAVFAGNARSFYKLHSPAKTATARSS